MAVTAVQRAAEENADPSEPLAWNCDVNIISICSCNQHALKDVLVASQ